MKKALKNIIKIAVTFLICFAIIYINVFLGVWKLFKSGDPLLIEIGAAWILSIFVVSFFEVVSSLEKRIKLLEKRLDDIEKKETE